MLIDALIPARGGSTRLPGKNLVVLGDRPLVAHSIRYALEHPLVRAVYVSTDSDEIAAVAREHGAAVLPRPDELADEHATISAVLADALGRIDELDPTHPVEAVATLQPTSPLRLDAWLDQCAARLRTPSFDSAITVSPVTSKVGTIDGEAFEPEYQLETRSQDMTPRYRENGAIYLTRATTIAHGSVFGRRIGAVVTDHVFTTIDIDTAADLAHAESVLALAP
ncbi:MAG: acylneuraminate cytidylyltransferase family protein [Acidimicrobiales bacterium]